MIVDQIKEHLDSKGFHNVKVNVNGIYIHYKEIQQQTYIVTLINSPTGNEFTSDQYGHIRNQIYTKFMNEDSKSKRLLCIICTNNVDNIRSLFQEDKDQWLIDTLNNKLILYENQSGQFLNLRNEIEDILLNNRSIAFDKEEQESLYDENEFRKPKRYKYVTKCNTILILINTLIFLFVDYYTARHNTNVITDVGSLYWPAIIYNHEYYRIITYMFLHSGFQHIINNMLVLFFIGDKLEKEVGTIKYVIIYFATGIVAGITSVSYNMLTNSDVSSIGASGAIFGVVGAMAYIVLVNRGRLESISSRQMFFLVFFSLYGGLTSQRVDNAAHIGGLISGVLFAAIFYRKHKKTHVEGDYRL